MHSPIVVTGLGIVSPLGCGVEPVWQRLLAGRSGIGGIDRFDVEAFPVKIAGLVPDRQQDPEAGFDPEGVVEKKEIKKLGLFTLYALEAARQALAQAGWAPQTEAERRATATVIATGIGGFPTITHAHDTLRDKGWKRLSPFVVPAFLANLAAGNISIQYGFKGPLGCPVTACAAGVQAIGDGMRMLRSGEAEVALVGGAEACVDPLSLGGFHAMKALSTRNDAPQQASRPFDQERDGFVMGEGAGLLLIETLAHAEARGAQPLAILSGYGTSADAYHIAAGAEDGSGAAASVTSALRMAGLEPGAIGYVNAHATSTPVGDRGEIQALRSVFGEALKDIPISSTKSATGHLLGAAGGIESVFSVLAVRDGRLPPTLNLDTPDESMADLDLVPREAKTKAIDHALSNGFGFGGVNASLIVSRS
ncbi:beta-ketoacyl-ACP synthase II [Acidihalobacter ferrooxydans]|uniref:3-oxoacyl-[acyl-carrier-protein] synthase 2 n=1 Tax=Acidihalobacter ferrooxydans TaxID=1765967 RepID=A0A1P8UJJ7_9GAMM|nr:beta-ketoacyl-ACP synthase II [Acidihalobacter ferrooxydans]APZ43971.1 beta-ketoacyl-[acyl-carrier-protein] synthase II [Acidihalobacter ferrooxydans]